MDWGLGLLGSEHGVENQRFRLWLNLGYVTAKVFKSLMIGMVLVNPQKAGPHGDAFWFSKFAARRNLAQHPLGIQIDTRLRNPGP